MEQLKSQQFNRVKSDAPLTDAKNIRAVPIVAEMYKEKLISEQWVSSVFSGLTTVADLEDMVWLLNDSNQNLQLVVLNILVSRKYTPGIPVIRQILFRLFLEAETDQQGITRSSSSRYFEETVAKALLTLSGNPADRDLVLDLARIRYQADETNCGIYALIEECIGSEMLLDS